MIAEVLPLALVLGAIALLLTMTRWASVEQWGVFEAAWQARPRATRSPRWNWRRRLPRETTKSGFAASTTGRASTRCGSCPTGRVVELPHREQPPAAGRPRGAVPLPRPLGGQPRAGPRGRDIPLRLRRRHVLPPARHDLLHVGPDLRSRDRPRRCQRCADSPFNKVRMCVLPKRRLRRAVQEPASRCIPSRAARRRGTSRGRCRRGSLGFERCVAELGKLGIEADVILYHPYDEGALGLDRMARAPTTTATSATSSRAWRPIGTSGGRWPTSTTSSKPRPSATGTACSRSSRPRTPTGTCGPFTTAGCSTTTRCRG